jgi:hypothetical protein
MESFGPPALTIPIVLNKKNDHGKMPPTSVFLHEEESVKPFAACEAASFLHPRHNKNIERPRFFQSGLEFRHVTIHFTFSAQVVYPHENSQI